MVRNLIVEFFPLLFIGVLGIYVIMKLFAMVSAGISNKFFEIFLRSFLPYGKEQIRNTFHEKLKKYYVRSNKLNTVFYIALGIILAIFLFMRMLG